MESQKQGSALFSGLLALIGVGVVVQMWLMATSVDALLGGHKDVPLRAAIASAIVFAINAALVLYVFAFDKRLRDREK